MDTKFADSVEATEFMDKIQAMLLDPRLQNWMLSTDQYFGTECAGLLADTVQRMEVLMDELESAA